MAEFVVFGPPIPQPRPTVARNGHRYYPANGIATYRRAIQTVAKPLFPVPIDRPCRLTVVYVFERPPSHYTKGGVLTAAAKRRPYPTNCDSDNLAKGLKDSLNGVAYVDDRLVVSETHDRIYGDKARTEIRLVRLH
jgi:Holliday junction resolvase RusA-like endonuclease